MSFRFNKRLHRGKAGLKENFDENDRLGAGLAVVLYARIQPRVKDIHEKIGKDD